MGSSAEQVMGRRNQRKRVDEQNSRALGILDEDPAASRTMAAKAASMALEIHYSKGYATATHLKAIYHLRSGDLKKAVEICAEALGIFRELNDLRDISSALNTMGIAFRNIGCFHRGLQCFMESLEIEKTLSLPGNLIKLHGNIGNIFDSMGQYRESLEYHRNCLEMAERIQDENATADAWSNLGICYHHLEDYSKSIRAHRRALRIRRAQGDEHGISFCLNNLGMIYEQRGRFERALEYYRRSLELKIRLNMKLETARACNRLGGIYTVTGDLETAGDFLKKGLKLSQEVNSESALRESRMLVSNLHRVRGEYREALQNFMEFHRLDREILDTTRIAGMEARLELMNSELYSTNRKLAEANSKLDMLSHTDGLTGIANRRRFDEFLAREWNRCLRIHSPVSLIMVDIDFFKLFNDTYGHVTGDDCLREVAGALRGCAGRATDLVARYGGEEFGLILSDTDSSGTVSVAKRAATAVKQLNIPHSSSVVAPRITVSMGLTTLVPEMGTLPSELVERADKALYFSKKQGRDRITIYTI